VNTDAAVRELVTLAWHQNGGVGPVPVEVLRGKHEAILESSSSGDDRGDYSSGVRCELEEELIAV